VIEEWVSFVTFRYETLLFFFYLIIRNVN